MECVTDYRAVEAPLEMIDQIGGWSLKSVGQGYGDGYSLSIVTLGCRKVVLSTADEVVASNVGLTRATGNICAELMAEREFYESVQNLL